VWTGRDKCLGRKFHIVTAATEKALRTTVRTQTLDDACVRLFLPLPRTGTSDVNKARTLKAKAKPKAMAIP